MKYIVHFKGKGYTAPSPENPKGIQVTAEGTLTVQGERPESNFRIPMEVVEQCKTVFMKQCQVVHYAGDEPGTTRFPTVWLAKAKRTPK